MDDKCIMENILMTAKGACDLFMHGTVESSTENVHATFSNALQTALNMQQSVYKQMSKRGWYAQTAEQQQKIDAVKQKFTTAK